MDHSPYQDLQEFRPPTIERAINDVKALLVEMADGNEDNHASIKKASLMRQNRLDNAILELLQAVLEEADPDSGIEACNLVFKEK